MEQTRLDLRLFWLALGSFTIGTEGFAVVSLLPAIAGDTGVQVSEAGTLIMSFAIAYAFGAPVLATLLGEKDRRALVSASMAVFALGNLVAGLASGFSLLVLARIVMALSAGLFASTAQAMAVAMSPPAMRGRAISIIVGGTTVAVAVGAPVGALIAGFAGWRGTFLTIAALAVVTTGALLVSLPRGLKGTPLALRERLTVALQPGIWPALLTTVLAMAGGFVIFSYMAVLAMDEGGLPQAAMPGVMLASGLGAALGNVVGGHWADRYGATRTTCLSLLAIALALTLISVLPHLVPQALLAAPLVGLIFAWGIVGWVFLPAHVSRIVGHAPRLAQISLSLNVSALYLGIALGSAVGGEVLRVASVDDLGWVGGSFAFLALLLVLATRVRTQPLAEGIA